MSVWNTFAEAGRKQLAATNGLTVEENLELHHTPVVDRAIELVIPAEITSFPDQVEFGAVPGDQAQIQIMITAQVAGTPAVSTTVTVTRA